MPPLGKVMDPRLTKAGPSPLRQLPKMAMTTDEDVVGADRQLLLAVEMAVGQKESATTIDEQQIVGHHRKLEQHLIDLCVAVATQGDDLTGSGVEVGDDALGVNALRDAVARTIVEDIAEDAEHIAMVLVIELEHFLQGWTAAVDV